MVVHLLPLAAPTETKVLTYRRHPFLGGLLDVQDSALEVVLFLFEDFDVYNVTRHPKGDEDDAAFGFGHRHAFAAGIDDFNVF